MGDKRNQTLLCRVWNRFVLPMSAGIDLPQSRCCGFDVWFTDKKHKTPQLQCRRLSHRPHPNKEGTCPYGGAKDGYLWCKIMHTIHQDMDSLSNTSICPYISIKWWGWIDPLIGSVKCDVTGPLRHHQNAVSCLVWEQSISDTLRSFRTLGSMRQRNLWRHHITIGTVGLFSWILR